MSSLSTLALATAPSPSVSATRIQFASVPIRCNAGGPVSNRPNAIAYLNNMLLRLSHYGQEKKKRQCAKQSSMSRPTASPTTLGKNSLVSSPTIGTKKLASSSPLPSARTRRKAPPTWWKVSSTSATMPMRSSTT